MRVVEDEKVKDTISPQEKSRASKVVAALAIASGCCVAMKQMALGGMLALCAAALREHGKRGSGDGTTSGTPTRASSMDTKAGGGACCLRMLRAGEAHGESGGQKPIPKAVGRAHDAGPIALGMTEHGADPYVSGDGGRPHPGHDLPEASSSSATAPLAPWEGREFQAPPRGVDRWKLTCWREGWLVRSHGQARKLPFHPIHSTLPCQPDQLGTKRVSVVFSPDGDREVLQDTWLEPRSFRRENWKGFTFIECRTATPETGIGSGVLREDSFELVDGRPSPA